MSFIQIIFSTQTTRTTIRTSETIWFSNWICLHQGYTRGHTKCEYYGGHKTENSSCARRLNSHNQQAKAKLYNKRTYVLMDVCVCFAFVVGLTEFFVFLLAPPLSLRICALAICTLWMVVFVHCESVSKDSAKKENGPTVLPFERIIEQIHNSRII